VYLDYNTCGEDHTMQMRKNETASNDDVMAVMDAFLLALSPGLNLVTIIGARARDAGGSVTYPLTWPGDPTYGSGAGFHYESANFLDFVGRSIGGRRCRISVFGWGVQADTSSEDYRLTTGESAPVAAALAVLEAGSGTPVAIDGDPVNFHQYANMGVNAYWRNHIR
jgi:hypothetical protein